MKKSWILGLFTLLALPVVQATAQASVRVLACEPEWGALVQELGGDKVDVTVATSPLQDPHHVQARPSLIARARNADMVACTGGGLEIGWLPILLQQSGNPAIQPGQPGNFAAMEFVTAMDVPARLDRADGDIHPEGNPHIQTDPRNIARAADVLSQRLTQIDPVNKAFYTQRHDDFSQRWQTAIVGWEAKAAPLRGMAVVVHHKDWSYLERWLGLREVGTLEPKPGVEPTISHMQSLLTTLQSDPARMVIRAAYQDERASAWLAERANIPMVVLPFTVGGTEEAKDLFGLFDDTIARLLNAAGKS
jgi:zinc/manganese transport system substrate-binding protein